MTGVQASRLPRSRLCKNGVLPELKVSGNQTACPFLLRAYGRQARRSIAPVICLFSLVLNYVHVSDKSISFYTSLNVRFLLAFSVNRQWRPTLKPMVQALRRNYMLPVTIESVAESDEQSVIIDVCRCQRQDFDNIRPSDSHSAYIVGRLWRRRTQILIFDLCRY